MHKIVSSNLFRDLLFSDKNLTQILEDTISEIDLQLDKSDVSDKREMINALKTVRASIAQAMLKSIETSRSRSSSLTSTGSLGDRLAIRDKEDYLYTYPWVNRSRQAMRVKWSS